MVKRGAALWAGLLLLGASACGTDKEVPPPIYVTVTPFMTVTPIVATETPGATSVLAATDLSLLPTQGATRTPTPTIHLTVPITMTPSFTPTRTDTPATQGLVSYQPVGGVGGVATTGCANNPQGSFASIYQADPNMAGAVGCALGGLMSANSAYQTFQNGVMIWVSSLASQSGPLIYVLFNNGTYQRFNDTWTDGVDPSSSGAVAPEGMSEPVRGFGKVWRESSGVRDTLGWATSGENGGSVSIQLFERGEMLAVSQAGQTYILITGAPGTWTARAGT